MGSVKIGVLVLNFGEPPEPEPDVVRTYLKRIFLANAELDGDGVSPAAARERARELADRRLPGLLEEYREIGGSPLNAQAETQARRLQESLRARDHDARVFPGMQFTEPSIEGAVRRARDAGVGLLVGLPVYPLCGRSTTVAALDAVDGAVEELAWPVRRVHMSGWHRHPAYLDLRADALRRTCRAAGIELSDPGTRLVFSAHGTPLTYLGGGSRYDVYVAEYCREVAHRLGDPPYAVGFQNHGNRRIPWTEPEIDDVVAGLDGERVVVDPASFMHEQSETLAELDVDLRQKAEGAGLAFHRVPVPFDDPGFVELLAEVVEAVIPAATPGRTAAPSPATARPAEAEGFRLGRCRCRPGEDTICLNSVAQPRELSA